MCGEFKRAKPATKLRCRTKGVALRPIIKLTRAFALVASDGIALIPCVRVCVCMCVYIHTPHRATRIALLRSSSVIEIRRWIRYSYKIAISLTTRRSRWRLNYRAPECLSIVRRLSRNSMYSQDLDFKDRKIHFNHGTVMRKLLIFIREGED